MTTQTRDWAAFAVPTPDGGCRLELAVEGITCAACIGDIERGIGRMPGIRSARLNYTTRRLAVDWTVDASDPTRIVTTLERLGYRAHPFDPGRRSAEEEAETRRLLRAMAVAGFAAMNVMLFSVSIWAGNATDITGETRDLFHWLSAFIALPAAAYAGQPFFESAGRALRALRTNMDVPISIGIVGTLALSLWQTARGEPEAYFDSAVMLLFFLLLGRFLDQNMRRRTRSVAENVAALRAETAARVAPDGTVREVPLSKVDPGDRVLVRPGERVSVDGVVETGASDIDQSLVTGETNHVGVGPGDRVYAGTLNITGALTVQVTAATEGTLLAEVNRLLEAAAQAKSSYMRLADRVARLYAPVVHTAALATFLGWIALGTDWRHALVIAVSVLIITCPCALALAIPAVQVVASGQLFRRGVLLHAGDAIERLAAADVVAFDKTGTLTLPEPAILDADRIDPAVLAAAGRLALSSRHPLGMALARAARADRPLPSATERPGEGVEAMVDGELEQLGSAQFCGADEWAVAALLARHPEASMVAYRRGNRPPVLFAFDQGLRPDAIDVVADLRAAGLKLEIISGDRPGPVAAIAEKLGIADALAGQHPADKIARLEALHQQGHKVLMVGDGLNDAPALAAAHVSLSPVTAVHLSQASADALFLGNRLRPVYDAIRTARAAKGAMVQNLWIAVIYNVIAVPLAVAGYVTPLIAALAMSGSSIIVTVNALRLRWGDAGAPQPPASQPPIPDRLRRLADAEAA
ncbi:MAG: cadmium-translocating P-type ATPase [Hyphomicrobiaceae bacterium]|nr:cadmium-translocating P-type ATPase [Hyphomicrobiaceae bacterium]